MPLWASSGMLPALVGAKSACSLHSVASPLIEPGEISRPRQADWQLSPAPYRLDSDAASRELGYLKSLTAHSTTYYVGSSR